MNLGILRRAYGASIFLRLPNWLKQLVKFTLVGLLNTGLDWCTYFVLSQWLVAGLIPVKTISYSLGVINSYIMNRNWTFDSPTVLRKGFPPFLAINLAGILFNSGCMYVALNFLRLEEFPALIFATLAVFSWNFLTSRRFVFVQKRT